MRSSVTLHKVEKQVGDLVHKILAGWHQGAHSLRKVPEVLFDLAHVQYRSVFQDNFSAGRVNRDGGIFFDRAVEEGFCELVYQFPLHQPFDGTGAV